MPQSIKISFNEINRDVLISDVINAKEYASSTCDKLYQSKETVSMTRYGYAFCALSFTANKMEEEAEKCRLWSKKEISKIISEIFHEDAIKDRVKDLTAKLAHARQPMVRIRDYIHFLQEATEHEMEMTAVAKLDSWKMVAKIEGDDSLSSRTRRRRKYLLPTLRAELKEEKEKTTKKATPTRGGGGGSHRGRGRGGRGGFAGGYQQPMVCKRCGMFGHFQKNCPWNVPGAMAAPPGASANN